MKNILLCGGTGTRLWPISRRDYPKQFCDLGYGVSLFQQAATRNAGLCDETIVVMNIEQKFMAMEQLMSVGINEYKLVLEPIGRNTAPAITLACLMLGEEDIALVTPSDHIILNLDIYKDVVSQAEKLANDGYMVTFGIKPTYPEKGFGYIESNGDEVLGFIEKPSIEMVERFLENGNYYWNSGMFVFRVKTLIQEMEKYRPDILENCKAAYARQGCETAIALDKMMAIPEDSIDYAVMEKSDKIKVVKADIGWSDLGSFKALYNSNDKDSAGNVAKGQVLTLDSKNSFIMSDERVVVTIGIEDLVVVDTKDALLISNKDSSHRIKELIGSLETTKKDITNCHTKAYRPWGSYTVLDEGPRYKVKQISVKPHAQLSLQKHFHRSEHWTIIEGIAEVRIGGKDVLVNRNESIFIPIGELHRLTNHGESELKIIETQVGDYLGEDDILRVDDSYGRK